jgi:hypothetical protein
MKPGKCIGIALFVYFLLNVSFRDACYISNLKAGTDSIIHLQVGGNTWPTHATNHSTYITKEGIKNWKDKKVGFDTYLRLGDTGTIKIKFKARADGNSLVNLEVNGTSKTIAIDSRDYQWYDTGEWYISDTGYLKLHLNAISKTGSLIADVSDYEISGSAINNRTSFVKNDDNNFFYWGRRGPSVHLNYPFADSIKAEWFYNELTVPPHQDIIGSYFMAIGFADGYFGIQVNSKTERRILFSVWSPFASDDPRNIPEDMRITLLKKGAGVHTGEFGNEGSGGQSFLRYNWKSNTSYKFLVKGMPDNNNNTVYTAYFFDPLINQWRIIASFKRPQTNHYLTRFHSFLENFIPEQGNVERSVTFRNQWIADNKGQWYELNKARFTCDNTGIKRYRMDFAGGIVHSSFFLKNCGFFDRYTPYNSIFERSMTHIKPIINFNTLP